jgi:hypothetical protein
MKQPDWSIDRFHIFFLIIAAGWIAIATATLQAYREVSSENHKLRTECGVAP